MLKRATMALIGPCRQGQQGSGRRSGRALGTGCGLTGGDGLMFRARKKRALLDIGRPDLGYVGEIVRQRSTVDRALSGS